MDGTTSRVKKQVSETENESEKQIKIVAREMRGIPYFLLKEYLQELGGTLTAENEICGEGWEARLEKMEPFRLGSLSIGQTRLTMKIREEFYDDFMARFALKTLRAGA